MIETLTNPGDQINTLGDRKNTFLSTVSVFSIPSLKTGDQKNTVRDQKNTFGDQKNTS